LEKLEIEEKKQKRLRREGEGKREILIEGRRYF
jgi:hypothetical protein